MTLVCGCGVDAQRGRSATPDITGTWERSFDEEPDQDADAPPGGPFVLKEPYARAYQELKQRQAEADAAGAPLVDASTRCLPQGMPTIMEAVFPIQILQNPGQVVILAEFLTQTRRIWLDAKMPPRDEMSPSYYGYSAGHWEGDTLVVETTGIRTDVLFFDVPHTQDMRVTERIRLTAPETLEAKIVIDDPQVLKQPYTFTLRYEKSAYKIQEYSCDDNQIVVDDEGKAHFKL